jgi:hypothetical protein
VSQRALSFPCSSYSDTEKHHPLTLCGSFLLIGSSDQM